MHKPPCNCGCIVSADGTIKKAWRWMGEGDCPSLFEMEEGDVFYELDHDTHEAIHKKLHLLTVDSANKKIVLKGSTTKT